MKPDKIQNKTDKKKASVNAFSFSFFLKPLYNNTNQNINEPINTDKQKNRLV